MQNHTPTPNTPKTPDKNYMWLIIGIMLGIILMIVVSYLFVENPFSGRQSTANVTTEGTKQ